MLQMGNYNAAGEILSQHPEWTNVMTNVSRVPQEKALCRGESTGRGGKRAMWRPEQKSVGWMKHLIRKFTMGEELVKDLWAGMCPTAKACMLLNKHRKLFGCDVDSEVLSAAQLDLSLTFTLQVLNPEADITEDERVRAAARAFKEKMAAVAAQRKAAAWEVPAELDATQVMPGYIVQFLSTLYEDYSPYESCQHIALSMSSVVWRNRLYSADAKVLLANECCRRGVSVRRSRIEHENTGNGLFAARNLAERNVIGSFYGSLVYADLGQELQSRRRYGEGYMEVTAESFRRWSRELVERVYDRKREKHIVWVVPTSFCAIQNINDPRYLERDKAKLETRRISPRTANVQFKAANVKSRSDFRKHSILQAVALTNITIGEELYVEYGSKYYFAV